MTQNQKDILKELVEKYLEGRQYQNGQPVILKQELDMIKDFVIQNF